jgi:hypothetical protein
MAKTSFIDIKLELLNFIRNQNIISTSTRGVTTSTDTGTFTAAATHTLAVHPTTVKNIRSVVVGVTTLSYGEDYTVNFETGVITFTVAQTGAYTIVYDEGTADRIYPDFPQPYLTMEKFPRIAIDKVSGSTREFGIGAATSESSYIVSIVCYDKSQYNVEVMIAAIRSALLDNKKTFHYIPFLSVSSSGPTIKTPFGENKIVQQNQDVIIKFIFEQ